MQKDNTYIYIGIFIFCIITGLILFKFINYEQGIDSGETKLWSGEFLSTNEDSLKLSDIQKEVQSGKKYINELYGFSFLYPEQYTISTFPDPSINGYVVLVQDVSSQVGFQVQITPFEEGITNLTPERIKRDLPDLHMSDVQELKLGDAGGGIAFISNNKSFNGNSREVWFVWKNNFYQVSTYTHLDPIVQTVMNTWSFR